MSAPLDLVADRYASWGRGGESALVRTIDTVGALWAGAATAEGVAVVAFARDWDGGVLGDVVRRVALARLTELDDIHMPTCTTPGAVVIPTAVTIGAALGSSPELYARAVEIGYDAMTRLGGAIDGALAVYRGLWPTYFCAPFAAAAVVATLLELPAEMIRNALALALTRATGLTSAVAGAPLARWLTVGDAARCGCSAAFAARDGFECEVELGRLGSAAGIELDASALTRDADPAIDAVSVKPFPTAKQSLAAAHAAFALRGRISVEEISGVRVYVPGAYAHMIANAPNAVSRLSRISSARWNVALALLRPAQLHDVERAAPVDDPALAHLAALVEVHADAQLERLFPDRWPARVVIGDAEEVVIDAPGDPPANGRECVEAKWHARGVGLDRILLRSPREIDDALRARRYGCVAGSV